MIILMSVDFSSGVSLFNDVDEFSVAVLGFHISRALSFNLIELALTRQRYLAIIVLYFYRFLGRHPPGRQILITRYNMDLVKYICCQ